MFIKTRKHEFPSGWHYIHPNMSFDFRVNRFYSLTSDPMLLYMEECGYDVTCFENSGQGSPLEGL